MAPIFVGPTDDDSKIRATRVGFAISTANPGTASVGDIYFNSTDKQLRGYNGSEWVAIGGGGGGTAEFTVSGSLSDGQTVIVQSDGTVAGAASTTLSDSVGTPTVYNSGSTSDTDVAYSSQDDKFVIAYKDDGSSSYGTVIVATINPDDNSVTFGTEVVFEYGNTNKCRAVYVPDTNKIVVAYYDYSNNSYGTAVAMSINGTSVSLGSPQVFHSGASFDTAIAYDSTSQRVVVAYRDQSNSQQGTARLLRINSDNSIDVYDGAVFNNGQTRNISLAHDTTNNKLVVAYKDADNNNRGIANVGTVDTSNNTISWGSESIFQYSETYDTSTVFDPSTGKILITYTSGGEGDKGKAVVGTVSGTDITFGTAVVFNQNTSYGSKTVYVPRSGQVLVSYRDAASGYSQVLKTATISGTTVSFGSSVSLSTSGNNAQQAGLAYDTTNNRAFLSYKDQDDSSKGKAVVYTPPLPGGTATAANFLGFSDAAYTNGQTATIQMIGSVDDAQTGLTTGSKFFVQNDGSIGTAASTPSIVAGTAISATKIIVRK
jgi:hypothetical protein|tara:strand:+ start:11 stop:1639 length:1629 start_codon:yes stop_codon:yes gene_type:complete